MYQLFEKYFPNVVQLKQEFLQSTWETLYMVFWTALIAGAVSYTHLTLPTICSV